MRHKLEVHGCGQDFDDALTLAHAMLLPSSARKRPSQLFCASQSDQGVSVVLVQVRVQSCMHKRALFSANHASNVTYLDI